MLESDFEALYTVASDPLIWQQHPESLRYQKENFRSQKALEKIGARWVNQIERPNSRGELRKAFTYGLEKSEFSGLV